ncbi:hypothetical protein CKO15_12730 [Halorhodospira abdelmalekii]|nr:hypothetical protein [Halorhodospira abdelmalekii]
MATPHHVEQATHLTGIPRDNLAGRMHDPQRGLGCLVAMRPALPTGLPKPFAQFIKVEAAKRELTGVLADPELLSKMGGWSGLSEFYARSVSPKAAERLNQLGFSQPKQLFLSEVVRREIGRDRRVAPDMAARLGRVLTSERVERLEFTERNALLAMFAEMEFLMADGGWRRVALPPRDAPELDKEDQRIIAFAPDASVADSGYSGAALALYRLARYQSGYRERQLATLVAWAGAMTEPCRQEAVLRYILEGESGKRLADELRRTRPDWLPGTVWMLERSLLVTSWVESDVKALAAMLHPQEIILGGGDPVEQALEPVDPADFLEKVHTWWQRECEKKRADYDKRTLPPGFDLASLRDREAADQREGWFTFFALGTFRTIGFGYETSHANFIEQAQRAGWWSEMARAPLPTSPQPWIDRLEELARTDLIRIDYPQWRRMLADLYVIARWLPDYVEAFCSLPSIARDRGEGLQLSDAWRISASPIWQRHGFEGAPITQSLGVGANWMIREAIRQGFWDVDEQEAMKPYAWATTRRLRVLFEQSIGKSLGERADMDRSPEVFRIVRRYLGDQANFQGDLDLPLQIWSQSKMVYDPLMDLEKDPAMSDSEEEELLNE